MGSSFSCPCPENSQREVIVIKQDGEKIKFTDGTRVTEILAAYPHHKMIRCSSDRSVLPDSHRLSSHQLYFLLPEGLDVCDATYRSLIKASESNHLRVSKTMSKDNNEKTLLELLNGDVVEKIKSFNDDDDDQQVCNKAGWKPALKTVPEVISPPLHTDA